MGGFAKGGFPGVRDRSRKAETACGLGSRQPDCARCGGTLCKTSTFCNARRTLRFMLPCKEFLNVSAEAPNHETNEGNPLQTEKPSRGQPQAR